MDNLKQLSETVKAALQLDYQPVSVRFSDALPRDISKKSIGDFYRDTACTALCRCLKLGKRLVVAAEGNRQGIPPQPCSGANFFFGWKKISPAETYQEYVEIEQVFASEKICINFLQQVPAYPHSIKKRLIILSPLSQESAIPQVVVFAVNAARASRILGASVYHRYQEARVIPAIPTCLSLYLPLTDQKVYVNFIDYYDRYHQGKQSKERLIWKEDEMIVSMTFPPFREMVSNIDLTPHGRFNPDLKPQIFDPIL